MTDTLTRPEESILSEKAHIKAIIDHVVDGIITISERGMIESFNPAARWVFG